MKLVINHLTRMQTGLHLRGGRRSGDGPARAADAALADEEGPAGPARRPVRHRPRDRAWAGPGTMGRGRRAKTTCSIAAKCGVWATCPPANSGAGCSGWPDPSWARSSARTCCPAASHPTPWTWAGASLRWAASSRPAGRSCSSNAAIARSGGRIRIQFQSGQYEFELGVTDIRLYGPDHVTPDPQVVERTAERLQAAESSFWASA